MTFKYSLTTIIARTSRTIKKFTVFFFSNSAWSFILFHFISSLSKCCCIVILFSFPLAQLRCVFKTKQYNSRCYIWFDQTEPAAQNVFCITEAQLNIFHSCIKGAPHQVHFKSYSRHFKDNLPRACFCFLTLPRAKVINRHMCYDFLFNMNNVECSVLLL